MCFRKWTVQFFEAASAFFLRFVRERVNRLFLISSVPAGKITLCLGQRVARELRVRRAWFKVVESVDRYGPLYYYKVLKSGLVVSYTSKYLEENWFEIVLEKLAMAQVANKFPATMEANLFRNVGTCLPNHMPCCQRILVLLFISRVFLVLFKKASHLELILSHMNPAHTLTSSRSILVISSHLSISFRKLLSSFPV